ncbi:GNAT family N-acetyltransferase [Crossiella sp. S99.1]|uniref:GNAT family N-acetyltransferase n=1 Tax=Crossiella sp. S99.1 TaxID=2936271 RepID=UPI0035AB68FD
MTSDNVSNSLVTILVRPELENDRLNELFHDSWPGHETIDFKPILTRSLVWVAAFLESNLVGFVNVIGDGGIHAIILDAVVHMEHRGKGVGKSLVCTAVEKTRDFGARVLHVDYEPGLEQFYRSCGFRTISGGLMTFSDDAPA